MLPYSSLIMDRPKSWSSTTNPVLLPEICPDRTVQCPELRDKVFLASWPTIRTRHRTPATGGASQVIDTMEIVYRWPGPVSGIEADDKTVFYTWTDPNDSVTVRAQSLDGGALRDLFPPESRFVNTARLVLDRLILLSES